MVIRVLKGLSILKTKIKKNGRKVSNMHDTLAD